MACLNLNRYFLFKYWGFASFIFVISLQITNLSFRVNNNFTFTLEL